MIYRRLRKAKGRGRGLQALPHGFKGSGAATARRAMERKRSAPIDCAGQEGGLVVGQGALSSIVPEGAGDIVECAGRGGGAYVFVHERRAPRGGGERGPRPRCL